MLIQITSFFNDILHIEKYLTICLPSNNTPHQQQQSTPLQRLQEAGLQDLGQEGTTVTVIWILWKVVGGIIFLNMNFMWLYSDLDNLNITTKINTKIYLK